jgi:microcystin-dependent protein
MPTNYSFVTGKTQLIDPNNGSFVDSWDGPVNSNWGVIDASVSGTTIVDLAANTTPGTPFVTLAFPTYPTYPEPWNRPLAAQNLRILLTGSLAYNVTVYIPAGIPGMWLVDNKTINGFTVTIKTNGSGSTGIAPPQGYMSYIFCDGTNIYWADQGNVIANVPQGIPPGAIMPFGMTTVPANWLICDGAAVSRSTYFALFAAIGTAWGTGDGSTTFNVPNFQGVFLRGWNPSSSSGYDQGRAFASYQPDTYLNHTHTATSTDAGHKHGILSTGPNANGGGAGWLINPQIDIGVFTLDGFAQITTTVAASTTGGTETTPKNYAVQYCIKT